MTQTTKPYDSVSIKKLDKSRVEITGSIPTSVWEKYRGQALKNINNSITIDGFRKGMIPENILVAKVGDKAILEEMTELALSKVYIDILITEKIDAIDKPEITVTKLATGNPLEFIAVTAVVPEVKLPDYIKIAATEVKKSDADALKVTEKDIDEAVLNVRKRYATNKLHSPENEEHNHNHDSMSAEDHDKAVEAAMPEITDEFVKTLGDFTDVADFRNKVSDMLAEKKRDDEHEKTRIRISDAIIDATTVDLPDTMIDNELGRIQAQFSTDVERMGVKLEDYLKHAKKTIEEIRTEWRPSAEKKAKLQLILNEISKKEKIVPDTKEVEEEVNHIIEHYKEADRERATVYAETVLTNEKVFQFLENSGK
jgi:FKBP-type peptidyl-prolyl cis-trans isomerase (trigger factor)